MKKYILLILTTLTIFSCSEEFLDKQPEDTLSPGTFYNNTDEIKTSLVGCYKGLQEIYGNENSRLPWTVAMMSDDGKNAYMDDPFHVFQKDNGESQSQIWEHSYKLIVNCNNTLAVIEDYEPKSANEESRLVAFRAEARFLRGLAYFNLARLYGDLPLVTERLDDPGSVFGIGRTPVGEVYNTVIIPDLEFAANNCYVKGHDELSGEPARATKGAALTILAKVYLTIGDFTKAEESLKKLIVDKSAGDYALLTNFADIFNPSNKFNDESIFEVNFNVAAGQPNYRFSWMGNGIAGYLNTKGTSAMFITHDYMREAFDSGDEIRYAMVDSGFTPNSSVPYQAFCYKYTPSRDQLPAVTNIGTDHNYIITRYADALLMYAEALMANNKKDQAVVYYNMIRERAEMPTISSDQLNIDMILHERRLEFLMEGHRYFDLVRTGKAIDVLTEALTTITDGDDVIIRTSPIPEYQLILPIPVGQIQIDQTLQQNPNY